MTLNKKSSRVNGTRQHSYRTVMETALSASPSQVDLCLQNQTLSIVSYLSDDHAVPPVGSSTALAALSSLSLKDSSSISSYVQRLQDVQARVADQPYSIQLRLQVAELYRALGFPDLAAGEAYRALLLVDEVLDESGEYHEQALEQLQDEVAAKPVSSRADLAQKHTDLFPGVLPRLTSGEDSQQKGNVGVEEEEACLWAQTLWSDAAYAFVAGNLLACGCLKSAHDFCSRGLKANLENPHLLKFRELLNLRLADHFASRGFSLDDEDITPDDYPDRTFVRRELYPWNNAEPDRYSPESLALLNEQVSSVAPKLEARVTELPLLTPDVDSATNSPNEPGTATIKQLGVFAREDVAPGETILDEKSLLTANARLHDSYCDACSAPLPDLRNSSEANQCAFCEDCDDIVFCSQDCHDLAQETYHPALCGNDVEAIAKDAPAAEAADALYSLLLLRALAMAETQDVHPLELKELKYIWGDYHIPTPSNSAIPLAPPPLIGPAGDAFGGAPRTLPFSFAANVLTPLHMLEKMDVDIFAASARYDFWVFNTLYAKLRGTASARQGRDGKPDVGAVHPLWCLANHSCDPNVAWEWRGNMRFWAREERVAWRRRRPEEQDGAPAERSAPGLRCGDEVLSHYCDIELDVKDRREWAAGALGGMCMCERCVCEAAADGS